MRDTAAVGLAFTAVEISEAKHALYMLGECVRRAQEHRASPKELLEWAGRLEDRAGLAVKHVREYVEGGAR